MVAKCYQQGRTGRRAFTLIELAIVLPLGAIVIALVAPAPSKGRSMSRTVDCQGRMNRISNLGIMYTLDYQDSFPSFSWRRPIAGRAAPAEQAAVGQTETDPEAALQQMTSIIRRIAGENQIASLDKALPGFVPYGEYSHLLLIDYASDNGRGGLAPQDVMSEVFTCPEDSARQSWVKDRAGLVAGKLPNAPEDAAKPGGARWAFSSSYEVGAAMWDRSQTKLTKDAAAARASQKEHTGYVVPAKDTEFRAERLTMVAFPGSKVSWFETVGRHKKGEKEAHFAAEAATVILTRVDGSVRIDPTAKANKGWIPTAPEDGGHLKIEYKPRAWEPAATNGEAKETVAGVYRWTRAGMCGMDFDGAEIKTGNP